MSDKYVCVCGKSFKSQNSLNAHKASCKYYLLQRDGNLDIYNKRVNNISKSLKGNKMPTEKCPYCGREVSRGNLSRHIESHKNGNYDRHIEYLEKTQHLDHDDLFCKYCGKECKNKNSLIQHEIRCKENPKRINVIGPANDYCNVPLEKRGWSKGLTKETDERVNNVSKALKAKYENEPGSFIGKHHTEEYKRKRSELAIANDYQSHWGTRKSYEYNGVKFISSYELEVAKDLDDNNIKWKKPSRLPYIDNTGKKHTYTPDFYLPDYDIYLDPKNDFLIENNNPTLGYSDKQKIAWASEQNNVKVIILNKNQLKWSEIKKLIETDS